MESPPLPRPSNPLSTILAFLHEIGLIVVDSVLDEKTSPRGLGIEQGKVLYDKQRLAYPGELLYAAAFLAVLPVEERRVYSTDLSVPSGADMSAIAWSYAASLHLGFDPCIVFHDGPGSIGGDSETILRNFAAGQFIGVPVLVWRGMTIEPMQTSAVLKGEQRFPAMLHWVCPQSGKSHQSSPKIPIAPFTGSLTVAREKFNALSAALLAEEGYPINFRDAAYDLYALFNELSGRPQDVIGADAFTWQQETLLPTGKAINPYSAATCLLDYARTRAFALGVRDAIKAAQKCFPNEQVKVLYAGTGPYAPLALLQTPLFDANEVQFTLIDIHEASLVCLSQVISVLGLDDYVEEQKQADATQWTPPDSKQYHVVVTEVMQRALIVEPQVAVTLALSKHLRAGGCFVPERIELTLCLLDPSSEQPIAEACVEQFSDYFRLSGDAIPDSGKSIASKSDNRVVGARRVIIGKSFVLTDSTATTHEVTEDGRINLPSIQLPANLPAGLELYILTRITTCGDIVLGDYDCGLTLPQPVINNLSLAVGSSYSIWYETLGVPGLRLS